MAEQRTSDAAPAFGLRASAPARPHELAEGVSPQASGFGPTGFEPSMLPAGEPRPVVRRAAAEGGAFDVCHVGVVLRAVLFVHGAVAVGALFGAREPGDWVVRMALGASVALPAVLLWLVAVCTLRKRLAALAPAAQWVAGITLGALAGGFGGVLGLGATGLRVDAALPVSLPWLAPVVAGAALAATLWAWLGLRERAHLPANTTARLAELQSRIRPHFLFNTLNTAITLARLDPARTEELLEDLAELFRVALTESGESVSLADEVALAQRYLAIEQIRFGERLRTHWELDPAAGGARVPPLLLQPLVENAVRHGVEPAAEGGMLRIRTRVRRGHAVITLANSVPDAPSRPGNGIALHNVRERLRLMHDVAARFDVRQEHGIWRVQIVVPL